jgi:hypothetical protein
VATPAFALAPPHNERRRQTDRSREGPGGDQERKRAAQKQCRHPRCERNCENRNRGQRKRCPGRERELCADWVARDDPRHQIGPESQHQRDDEPEDLRLTVQLYPQRRDWTECEVDAQE